MFQKKNECSLEAHRFKSLVSIKLFTWNIITIMGMQDRNTKNSIKSKNYHKSKTLREFEKLYNDWMVYCYEAKGTEQWAEENMRKDVCWLNSNLTSTTNTQLQIDSSLTKSFVNRPETEHTSQFLVVQISSSNFQSMWFNAMKIWE